MKNVKKMMALVIAMVMVLGTFSIPAMAAVPENGSITVNSPIMGATYSAYKVFDMAVNDGVTAFSYSIKGDNKFFDTVMAYANMPAAGATTADANTDGLTLKVTADTADAANAADKVYMVDVDSTKFDPQAFGQYLLAAMQREENPITPVTAVAPKTVTVDDTDNIKFEELPLGYFLITSEYPKADYSTVTMTVKDYDGTLSTAADDKYVFGKDDLEDPTAETLALKATAKVKITQYVGKVVDDDYVQAYINDKGLVDKDANKNDIPIVKGTARWDEVKQEIIDSMTEDAEKQILGALANQLAGSESDINLAKEPILVFLDSSQPDAVINEKNEIDKWDVPVNPSGDALPEDIPDHGEPDGGKNIVIKEADNTTTPPTPAVYADWSEASIGDSIHYQLRVNAMNFVRETAQGDQAVQTTADKVQQIKEYFLADYQNPHMSFDADKFLRVTVIDDNGRNVTKNKDGETVQYLDYTTEAQSKFFKNGVTGSSTTDVLGTTGGIMVPWVKVSEANAELDTNYPIYTETVVPKVDAQGNKVYKTETPETDSAGNPIPATTTSGTVIPGQFVSTEGHIINASNQVLDPNNNPIQDTDKYYVYSLYNSDVTIVVDYYMILNDDAVIDGDGNPNYAQYGYSPVDNKNQDGTPKLPTPPDGDEDKPSQKKEVDDATVYTYALAFVKINSKAEALANATFELPFYVKKTKAADGSYVFAFDKLGENNAYPEGFSADNTTNTLTTPANGVITIKGITQGVYSITETEAPVGYNKLTEPFEVEAKKTGEEVITTKTHTIYLDAQGNVTSEETAVTVTTHTSDGNLPVYEFKAVENKQGQELPATGGMGTTLFYAIGAILVLGAGILLVTKRRMSAE